jgi:hypothetical protein
MKDIEYFSTGEAARMLGISRSTVSRRFDEGALLGKAHPITGERLISAESIDHFLKEYVRPVETSSLITRQLVLRSNAQDLIGLVESVAAGDRRIKMDVASRGSEALIICARNPTDLLILDDTPTDITSPAIIRSLREIDARHILTVLCCLRDSNPQQVAIWGADAQLPLTELNSTTLETCLYELLRLTRKEHNNQTVAVEHKRQWPRHTLNVAGTIGVYRVPTPEEQMWGSVTVDNISLGGAGLSNVKIHSNSLPAESFRMLLQIDAPQLQDWQAHCQVVRLKVNGQVTAGVQFMSMSQDCQEKLKYFERTCSLPAARDMHSDTAHTRFALH